MRFWGSFAANFLRVHDFLDLRRWARTHGHKVKSLALRRICRRKQADTYAQTEEADGNEKSAIKAHEPSLAGATSESETSVTNDGDVSHISFSAS